MNHLEMGCNSLSVLEVALYTVEGEIELRRLLIRFERLTADLEGRM